MKTKLEYVFGVIVSTVSGSVLGFVYDMLTAIFFGALGAFGAWLFHVIKGKIEKIRNK